MGDEKDKVQWHFVPIGLAEARAFIKQHHRHSIPPVGHKFSISLQADDVLVGVAVVGRPVSRLLDDGMTAEILRVCVIEGAPHGSPSKLYSRAKQIAQLMGYSRIITYTLQRESGASLRAAGFSQIQLVPADEWSRHNRPRRSQPVYSEDKIRWEKQEPE